MEDRVFFPVLFQFLHGQSLEQLLFPLEVGLQRGQQQAFPEASGAAEEVILSGSNQLIDQGCLVNIEIAVLANFLEVLYADRINCLVHSDDRLDILTMNKDRHSFLSEQDKNI